jgi:DUF4097 and DUF4098 domain-containing protein YvlB
MKFSLRFFIVSIAVVSFISLSVSAGNRNVTFEFEDIQSMEIETICGSVEIIPGETNKFVVELQNDLDDPEDLEPEVEANRGELTIEEHFTGRNVRGSTYWTIYVPKSAQLKSVEFSAASGGFEMQMVNASFIKTDIASGSVTIGSLLAKEFDLSTASGDIEMDNCQVDMVDAESASGSVLADNLKSQELDLSTASGKVILRLCQADYIKASSASGRVDVSSVSGKEMDLSSASGRVTARECVIEELVEMSCASGDVQAQLARLPSDILHASTASGDVMLEVPDFGENFSMTLTKREDRGRVKCPFDYDDQEIIRLHKHDDHLYERYYVQRGKGGPEIELSTASGAIRIDTDSR